MTQSAKLGGVELYFNDLDGAKSSYQHVLGFGLDEDAPNRHAKFALGSSFLCLERKGVEDYPSADKAVAFVEVADVRAVVSRLDSRYVVGSDPSSGQAWAALRDPEGHTVMLLEAAKTGTAEQRDGAGGAERNGSGRRGSSRNGQAPIQETLDWPQEREANIQAKARHRGQRAPRSQRTAG